MTTEPDNPLLVPIRRPLKVAGLPNPCMARLWFLDGDDGQTIWADYYLMGGISWPFAEVQGKRFTINGYAVLCGQNSETGLITVFENTTFRSVDPIMDRTGRITEAGLSQWLNRNWTLYQSKTYWYYEQGTIHLRYAKALRNSRMVDPNPFLRECQWYDDGSPEHLLWIRAQEQSLRMPAQLQKDIEQGDDAKVPCAARHALLCALVGYEMRPYREPFERQDWKQWRWQ